MGLFARDPDGNILHDIPDAVMQINSQPMGHLYFNAYDESEYVVVGTSAPTFNAWTTGIQSISKGNTNIKGVRLNCYVMTNHSISGIFMLGVLVRPTGSAWAYSLGGVCPRLSAKFYSTSISSLQGILDVPISADGQFDYYFLADDTGSIASKYIQLNQNGIWV